MTSDALALLARASLAVTFAIVLMLAARRPLRRLLGAGAACQAWLVVPLALLVSLLPARMATLHQAAIVQGPLRALGTLTRARPASGIDWVVALWLAGAVALALWFLLAQRAFLRRAGTLTPHGAIWISSSGAGPASVGLWRPRIVVPHDFGSRYSPAQQALIIAHEQMHIDRHDAAANLVQALLQCVFWCHPLVHLAARCWRVDQELACDAAVMRRHPGQRRAYAEALLASAMAPRTPGLNSHWQARFTTKERLMQLQQTPPDRTRRLAGRCIVVAMAGCALFGALGARAGDAPATTYAVALTIDAAGAQSAPRVLARAGEPFGVAVGAWRVDMTVRPARSAGEVWIKGTISRDGAIVSSPTLLARVNEQAGIKVGDSTGPFAMSMVVTPQP